MKNLEPNVRKQYNFMLGKCTFLEWKKPYHIIRKAYWIIRDNMDKNESEMDQLNTIQIHFHNLLVVCLK